MEITPEFVKKHIKLLQSAKPGKSEGECLHLSYHLEYGEFQKLLHPALNEMEKWNWVYRSPQGTLRELTELGFKSLEKWTVVNGDPLELTENEYALVFELYTNGMRASSMNFKSLIVYLVENTMFGPMYFNKYQVDKIEIVKKLKSAEYPQFETLVMKIDSDPKNKRRVV